MDEDNLSTPAENQVWFSRKPFAVECESIAEAVRRATNC